MKPLRLIPEIPFPAYIFIPGENPHPKKMGGHMEGEKDPIADVINKEDPGSNQHFRFALDLYNHGYFWESHVYFEALWNAHGRVGSEADFLKAMIKLGAAGVKWHLQQSASMREHYLRAQELLSIVRQNEGENFLGFNLKDLIDQIESAVSSQVKSIHLTPRWS